MIVADAMQETVVPVFPFEIEQVEHSVTAHDAATGRPKEAGEPLSETWHYPFEHYQPRPRQRALRFYILYVCDHRRQSSIPHKLHYGNSF
jgi:hypothetical protein